MRLAFSTNAYRRFPFEEAAARISALGYEGLELMADVPHAWPAGLLEGPKRAIRAAMEGNSLAFSNVNAFMMNADQRPSPSLSGIPRSSRPDEGYRRVRIDHTRRALALCKPSWGAPHITTEPGGPIAPGSDPGGGGRPVRRGAQAAGRARAQARRAAPDRAGAGILLVETTDQYLEIAERVDAPSIGLNFDVGHAYCVERGHPGRHRQAGPAHRALSPFRGHRRDPRPPPPGSGPGRDRLRRGDRRRSEATGYDGWLTVELYPNVDDPDAAAREAIEYPRGPC